MMCQVVEYRDDSDPYELETRGFELIIDNETEEGFWRMFITLVHGASEYMSTRSSSSRVIVNGYFPTQLERDEANKVITTVFLARDRLAHQGDAETKASEKPSVHVPSRRADRERWARIWRQYKKRPGTTRKEFLEWLCKMRPDDAVSDDTLTKIVRAGNAGALDL